MTDDHSGDGPKTDHTRYVEAFIALLQAERPDPVKRELLTRLDGRNSTMAHVRSPPVVRGEHDRIAILFRVIDVLTKHTPPDRAVGPLTHLRRVLVDCVEEVLDAPEGAEDRIEQLGYLIAAVADDRSPPLARSLRRRLWGALAGNDLPCPLAEVITHRGTG